MAKKISITNQKGGVGKTTTAINLSAGLGKRGFKCLVIDLDPQGNLTTGFGISKHSVEKSVFHLVVEKATTIEDILIKNIVPNVDLAPATIDLAAADVYIVEHNRLRENILEPKFKTIEHLYDYIIIDCPPSLGLLNRNGIAATNGVIIPIQTEYYALEGLTQLLSTIKFIKKLYNPKIKIEGILLTMFDMRTNLSTEIAYEVRKYFGEKVYKTYIPRNVKISESQSAGLSIYDYNQKSAGAKAYSAFVGEVIGK